MYTPPSSSDPHQAPDDLTLDHSLSQWEVEGERPHPTFLRLGGWVLSHWVWVLSSTLALTLMAFWVIGTQISVDNSMDVFAPADADVMKSRARYRDLFGRDDLIMISAQGPVFTRAFLEELKALEEAVKKVDIQVESLGHRRAQSIDERKDQAPPLDTPKTEEGLSLFDPFTDQFDEGDEGWGDEAGGSVIEETISLISARRTHHDNGGLTVSRWFDPLPDQAEIDARRPEALSDPLLARRLVDDEGHITVLLVRVAFMRDEDLGKVYGALKALAEERDHSDFRLRVTGPPAVNAALNEVMLSDLSDLLLLSGCAMLLALIYLFRAPMMVIGPMVVVSLSVVWTLGVMALTGMTLNLLSSILPAFLLCVGLGDSVHMQSIYRTQRRRGMGHRRAIVSAFALTGPPVLFTSMTTMIGLFSFKFATVTAVQEMGLAGGVGVSFALLHSLITLPLFLLWQGDRDFGKMGADRASSGDRIDRMLNALVRLSSKPRGRVTVLLFGVCFSLVAIFGVSQLEVWHDDLETLPADHPIKRAVLEVDEALGGVASAQLLIETDRSLGVKDLDLLRGLDRLATYTLNYKSPQGERIVGHALSPVNVIKETRRALTNTPENYALPDTQEEANELMGLFEMQSPDQLRSVATIDLKSSHLTFQIKWQEATSYAGLIDHIDEGIRTHIGSLAQVTPTGGVYLAYTIVSALLSDLSRSFGAAFGVITLLMVMLLRSWKLGALAMIPNLFPILLMLGGLGILGVPLDLNTLLVASIALGIAVDDTIHLLHHFQSHFSVTGDREGAIQSALTHAGRAMVSTSVLLCAGFSVNLTASTEPLRRFGAIISLTVLVALFVDLILCPALLRWLYPERVTQKSERALKVTLLEG